MCSETSRWSRASPGSRPRRAPCGPDARPAGGAVPRPHLVGLLSVLTRAASTITVVAIFALGALLVKRGELTVGEIVGFVAFADLLICKLDQLSRLRSRTVQPEAGDRTPISSSSTRRAWLPTSPAQRSLPNVAGSVRYEDVSFRLSRAAIWCPPISISRRRPADRGTGRPHRSGKTTTLALLQRLREPDRRPHPRRRARHSRRHAHFAAPAPWRSCSRTPACSTAASPRTCASAGRTRPTPKSSGPPSSPRRMTSSPQARRLWLRHRRARRIAVGRRAPAPRHRPRHPQGCPDPHPRRGHQRPRRRDRGAHQAGARPAAARAAPPSSSPTGSRRSPMPT